MESDEKKALEKADHVDQERSTSSINQDYDEAFNEPHQEESLHRGLKARQISMIAVSAQSFHRHLVTHNDVKLGGAVGTGLIIGSGTALRRGGPLGEFDVGNNRASRSELKIGLFLGYSFVGFVCYLVMVSLGEMAAFLPHKKGFAGYATRFVDPALGFALGWNYLLKYVWSTVFLLQLS